MFIQCVWVCVCARVCVWRSEKQKWNSVIQIEKVTHRCRTPPPGLWPSGRGASWTAGPSRPRRTRRGTGCSTHTRTPRRPSPGTGTAGSRGKSSRWTSSWRDPSAKQIKRIKSEQHGSAVVRQRDGRVADSIPTWVSHCKVTTVQTRGRLNVPFKTIGSHISIVSTITQWLQLSVKQSFNTWLNIQWNSVDK